MTPHVYKRMSQEEIMKALNDIFTERDREERKFHMYIQGSAELIDEWNRIFDEAIKKEIGEYEQKSNIKKLS
jgi:hypothetical protein